MIVMERRSRWIGHALRKGATSTSKIGRVKREEAISTTKIGCVLRIKATSTSTGKA